MYIRRKVFSVAIDENGEEKLFSTTEIMSEDSYIEKVYAEAEEAEKKSSVGKKVAIGAGATAGVGAAGVGGIYGAGKLGEKIRKNRILANRAEVKEAQSVIDSLKNDEALMKMKQGKESLSKAQEALKNAGTKKAGAVEKNLIKVGNLLKKVKK
jgi:hypothetical protein